MVTELYNQSKVRPPEEATADFQIVPIEQVSCRDVVTVINQAFDLNFDEQWFRWKHHDNPFGPSLGWAAVGADGVLGIRLFMCWELRLGKQTLHAVRPVDTATAPQAQRSGVFRALTSHAVAAVMADANIDLIFNTPNANSRPGYARMGWTILPPLAHGVGLVLPGKTAALQQDEGVFAAFDAWQPVAGRLCTERSAAFMRWRYHERSGVVYGKASLRQAEMPNALIYRVVKRSGIHLLVINELVGSPAERSLLVRSVARQEKAVALLAAMGTGAFELVRNFHIKRGHSVVAVRPVQTEVASATKLDSWALTLGDLEGVL